MSALRSRWGPCFRRDDLLENSICDSPPPQAGEGEVTDRCSWLFENRNLLVAYSNRPPVGAMRGVSHRARIHATRWLLRPTHCLSQRDFCPAKTHRNPAGDQLEHELAGPTTVIRQVIG